MGWKLEDVNDLGTERGEFSWRHSDLRYLFHVVNTDTDEKLHLSSAKHFQEICDRDLQEDDEPQDDDLLQQVQQQRVQQQHECKSWQQILQQWHQLKFKSPGHDLASPSTASIGGKFWQ